MGLLIRRLAMLGALAAVAGCTDLAAERGEERDLPLAAQGDHDAFFTQAVGAIEESNMGNSALVLIEDGEVVGEYYAKSERAVDAHTVFPTASFSKWITAIGVMSLVEEGRIDLDDPVSMYLTRWRLSDGPYDENGVTVRRLLSHTAGLTDGLGFGDYGADEDIPSLEQSLTHPRASSGEGVEIAVGAEPGTTFGYSGGGYLILQLLIEEVTGQDYENYIRNRILEPLQMEDSSFAFIGDVAGATQSFHASGAIAPQYRYAAAGATGFSTSAADLVRLVKAHIEEDPALGLSPSTLRAMRASEAFDVWGLGTILYAPTGSGSFVYGHDGANDPAINVAVRINPESGDAFIMLVNGHASLATQIGGSWVFWQTGNRDFLSRGE